MTEKITSNGIENEDLGQIFVIIPVLNEEATIADVIKSLKSCGLSQICVVDNGSSDHTVAKAESAGAKVVREARRGYGQACWCGWQEIPENCDWILFCDGDGSDDFSQLPQFFEARKQADFILGNRRADSASRAVLTPVQNFGNALATFLIGIGWGYWYQDLGPLRLIKRTAFERIQMQDRSFGWTVEMQARVIELGLNILEIPVNYRPRQGGKSKISGTIKGSLEAGSIILSTLGKLYLQEIIKKRIYHSPLILWLSAFFLLLGVLLTVSYGDFQQVGIVAQFYRGISVMSVGFILSWALNSVNIFWFWGITLLTRILILPMYPSDDIWRYLWEGYLQNIGFSPYEFAPNAPELIPYRTDWWQLINNIDTSAIYPPLAQLGFRFLALFSTSVLIFKLAFVLADLGICWLLSKKFGYQKTLLYAWNPLIIYSFAGAGHYDTWFLLPLVAGWLAFEKNNWRQSAFFLGLSVTIKWISLPIMAFFIRRWQWQQIFIAVLLVIIPIITTALGFCNGVKCYLIPTGSTFVSHGRSAELLPYLIGLVWPFSRQHNWIYALPLGLIAIILWRYCQQFVNFIQSYFFFLLTLSPIVHAWYFTWLIPFAVVTRNLGVRWVSLSSFIYFVLKDRQTLGNFDWTLTPVERLGLWLPFILGFLWSYHRKNLF
jgi:glycosyltransferase involved in cell wall biosynthesis